MENIIMYLKEHIIEHLTWSDYLLISLIISTVFKFRQSWKNETIKKTEVEKETDEKKRNFFKKFLLKEKVILIVLLVLEITILFSKFYDQKEKNEEISSLLKRVEQHATLPERNEWIKFSIDKINKGELEKARITMERKVLINANEDSLYTQIFNTARDYEEIDEVNAKNYFILCTLIKEESDVYYLLGEIQKRLAEGDRFDESINYFKKAIELDSKKIKAYISVGEIYELVNEIDDAEMCFKNVINIDESNEIARKRLAFLYYKAKNYDLSAQQFKELTKLNQKEDDYFYHLAHCEHKAGNLLLAEAAIRKAIDLKPKDPEYYRSLIPILEDPTYPKTVDISPEIISKKDTPKSVTIDSTSIKVEEILSFDRQDEYTSGNTDKPVLIEKSDDLKDYSMIRMTVVNASTNRNAAKNLGFLLKENYGLRYAEKRHKDIWNETVVYYKDFINRNFAKEIVKNFPGDQKYELLPHEINIKEYNDIVIFIGNDCRNVNEYSEYFKTFKGYKKIYIVAASTKSEKEARLIADRLFKKEYNSEVYLDENENYAITIGPLQVAEAKAVKEKEIKSGLIRNDSRLLPELTYLKRIYKAN